MFRDRTEAAARLAKALKSHKGRPGLVVLAVPRGGLPIGAGLARELDAKLDVLLAKKIGHPDNPEVAIGAVSLSGEIVDPEALARGHISPAYVAAEIKRIRQNLRQRSELYRRDAPPVPVAGRTVILTDDGAATGHTLMAAIALLRREKVRHIVVAIPVAPPDTAAALEQQADEFVCLEIPRDFMAIGQYYADFSQVTDEEAVTILKEGGLPCEPRK